MDRTLFSLNPWPIPVPCNSPCACYGACKPGYISEEQRTLRFEDECRQVWTSLGLRAWVLRKVMADIRDEYGDKSPRLEYVIQDAILRERT